MSSMQLPDFRGHWALVLLITALLVVCLWHMMGQSQSTNGDVFRSVDLFFQRNPMAGAGLHRTVNVLLPKTAAPEDVVQSAAQSSFTKYKILGIRSVPAKSNPVIVSDWNGTIQFGTTMRPTCFESLILSDRGEKLISSTYNAEAKNWSATFYDISNFPSGPVMFGDEQGFSQ